MSEELKNADPAEVCDDVQPDPQELALARFRKQLETGDFKKTKAVLEDLIGQAEPEVARGLEHQRVRLRLDPIAIAVMAVCGGLLTVLLTINLFH